MFSRQMRILALLIGFSTPCALAQEVLSPVRYEIGVEVDYQAELLRGTTRLILENPSTTPVQQVSLLLYRLLRVDSVRDDRGSVLPYTQSVVSFTDFRPLQVNHVVVTLPRPLAPGQRTTLQLGYSGSLLGYAETGMEYIKDRIDTAFTILRDDSWVFPQPGIPSIMAFRSAPPRSYSYAARITVPRGLRVVNGGRLDGVDTLPNARTFRYSNERPAGRMDFAIARYGEISDGAIRIFYLPGDSLAAAGVARAAAAALDLLTSWFGPPGATSGLTFIEIPEGWGSQSDGPTIIQTAAAFRDPQRYDEVYHELSHWWNVPSTDRPSPRLEEGLASFLQYLVTEKVTGKPTVDAKVTQVMERLRKGLPDNPAWRQTPLVEYGRSGSTDLSYRVGAVFFDLLYRLAGPEAFNRIIRTYTTDFGAKGGSTRDFVEVISQSAAVDLSPLVSDWLYTVRWTDRLQAYQDIQALTAYYRNGLPER